MLAWYLKVSRPRFWFYALGPYLIGAVAANQTNNLALLILFGLYFTLPANLLIYGVNDIFDYETDKHNPKKQAYEELVTPEKRRGLLRLIILLNGLPIILLPLMPPAARYALLGFFFFGIFYSAPPIRAKTKPFLDSFFNILYIFPGLVSYGLLTDKFPAMAVCAAATLWCMAMHAYSAVPDIMADKKARINTIATWLGARGTLLFCTACYLGAAWLAAPHLGWFSAVGGAVYGLLMLVSFAGPERDRLFAVYRWFPLVNLLMGMGLFFWIAKVL